MMTHNIERERDMFNFFFGKGVFLLINGTDDHFTIAQKGIRTQHIDAAMLNSYR